MQRFIRSYANDAAIQAAVDDKSLGKPYVALNNQTGQIDWNGKDINYAGMYLTIRALSGGTFYVRNADVDYSINGAAWETTTGETALSLNQGDEVRFRDESYYSRNHIGLFSGNTLSHVVFGNIESLEYGDNFKNQVTNYREFLGCFEFNTGLMSVENLILPATNLSRQTYDSMFYGCSSIEKAPVLPATEPAERGYQAMFRECSNLSYVKCMLTDLQLDNPWGPTTQSWLLGVSATGTFVKKAGVTWPTGGSGIPSGWTVVEE